MAFKVKPALPQLINPNMIVEAIKKHFDVQLKPIDKLVYRKPYLEWVDRTMPFSKGYKVPNFMTFLGDDDKSTLEHVG